MPATPEDRRPSITLVTIGPRGSGKSRLAAGLSYALREWSDGRFTGYRALTRGGRPQGGENVGTVAARWLELATARRRYTLLDTTGDSRYVCNQLAPLAWADAALLVVSAPEWSPEAAAELRQRMSVASHLGVERAVGCLTGCDTMDPSLIDLVETEVRGLLIDCGFAQETPFVRMVYERGAELVELAAALDEWLVVPRREREGPLLMTVLRGFRIAGRGAVAVASIDRGEVRVGDPVELIGTPRENVWNMKRRPVRALTEIGSLRRFETPCERGDAGETVGAMLKLRWTSDRFGWNATHQVTRGMRVAAPGALQLHERMRAAVRLATAEEGGSGRRPSGAVECQMLLRTGNEGARLRLDAAVGETVEVTIEIGAAVPVIAGERFVLRHNGRLLAFGEVLATDGPAVEVETTQWW